MNGFERRKQRKMEQIRESALHLFSQQGFQKVNIQDIAKAASVSQVTIYNYFGSKDALTFDVIKQFLHKQKDAYQALINDSLPYPEKIEKLIVKKIEDAKFFSPAFLDSLLHENKEIADYLQTFAQEKTFPMLAGFFQEGKDGGWINQDMELSTIFAYMNMFSNEIMTNPALRGDESMRTKFSRDFMQLFFYGLIGKPLNKDD